MKATVFGTGETHVVFCHGWMGDYTVFNPLIENINKEEFTFHFVDYRGYGKSKDISGEFTIEEIAKDVVQYLAESNLSKVNLVGHSMGGLVIQKVLTLASKRVEKLIAITPVPASGYPMEGDTKGLFDNSVEDVNLRQTIVDFTTGSRLPKTWSKTVAESSLQTTTKEAFGSYLKAWTLTNIYEEVEKLQPTQPITVLVGENDPAINIEMMEASYKKLFSNCDIQTLANSGHYPMQEIPLNLLSIIESSFA